MSRLARQPVRLLPVVLGSMLLALLVTTSSFSPAAAQDVYQDREAQQELVERFAPIVIIPKLLESCTHRGEQFRPVPVDILFGSPDVTLKKRTAKGKPDEVIKTSPVAQDLAGLDDTYYLDLPGNPRDPRCTYQNWNNARMAELGIEPSVYASVRTEDGQDGIVVQYWFYWVFNLFNDTHESDWEGIQLNFSANSAQEILDNNLEPDSVAFAQHGGGEYGDWDDEKVERDGNHVVVYPSAGSHASYYNATTWLGWGENGSGFGCDLTNDPNFEIPVQVILLPDEVDPVGEFAWLTFEGRWGQHEPSVFDGPQGPNTKPRWNEPLSWSESIRPNSLPIPAHETIGPSPSGVFCMGAEIGSRLIQYFPVNPGIVAGMVLVVLGLAVGLAVMAWRYLARAIELYLRQAHIYLVIGVAAVPVAALGARVEGVVLRWVRTTFDSHTSTSDRTSDVLGTLLSGGASTIQEVLMIALLAPSVTYATYELARRGEAHALVSWKEGAMHMPGVFAAAMLNAVMVFGLAITVVLIPWAIYKGVHWFFVSQAIVIDGATVGDARHVSSRTVSGHWRRALAIVLWVAIATRLPGAIIGTLSMVVGGVSVNTAEWISGVVYCMIFPIGIIASTLFYMNVKNELEKPVEDSLIRRAFARARSADELAPTTT